MLCTGLEIEALIRYLWESKESPSPSGDAQEPESSQRQPLQHISAKGSLGSLSSCYLPFKFLMWGVRVHVHVCLCFPSVISWF